MSKENDQPATKADISLLKADLKTDVKALQVDMAVVKAAIVNLDQKVGRVAVALVNTQADVRRIEQYMATKKDVERILGAIDAFAMKSENVEAAR